MRHGMVTASGYDVLNHYTLFIGDLVDSDNKQALDNAWNDLMAERG